MTAEGSEDLARLGREAARSLGDGPDAARRARQRARLVATETPAPGGRRTSVPWLAVALGGAAALLVGWWALGGIERDGGVAEEPSPVEVVAGADDGEAAGRWIRAPGDAALEVPFDDGSTVRFAAGARGRIARATGEQRTIVLEDGEVAAEIEPGTGHRWAIEAGPYAVTVVGTVFVVHWDSAAEHLDVEVSRGRVQVSGGPIGDAPIPVDAGRRLDADLGARTAGVSPLEPAVDAGDTDADRPRPPTRGSGGPPHGDRPPAASIPAWKQLAIDGSYAEALAAAEELGFDRLVDRLPADDLKLLADAARLAPDTARATEALEALHRRFPNTRAGRLGAFLRARLAMDAEHDPKAAIRWLRVYLDSSPHGTFTREAQGRLIDALRRVGDLDQARTEARAYLAAYPDGPHAALARSLVDGG